MVTPLKYEKSERNGIGFNIKEPYYNIVCGNCNKSFTDTISQLDEFSVGVKCKHCRILNSWRTKLECYIDMDDYFYMDFAELTSTRSLCVNEQGGVVAVDDNKQIITFGFNAPSKLHSDSVCSKENCKCLSCEMMLVLNCATSSKSLKGSTIYISRIPGPDALFLLINCGIKRLCYSSNSIQDEFINTLESYGILHTNVPNMDQLDSSKSSEQMEIVENNELETETTGCEIDNPETQHDI